VLPTIFQSVIWVSPNLPVMMRTKVSPSYAYYAFCASAGVLVEETQREVVIESLKVNSAR
jgi:hypothetical protein